MMTRIALLFLALFTALPIHAASTDAKANAKQSVAPPDKKDVPFILNMAAWKF